MKKEYIGNAKIIDKSRLPQVGTLCRNYYIDKKYCEDKMAYIAIYKKCIKILLTNIAIYGNVIMSQIDYI